MNLKYSIPIGWQYGALSAVMMLLFTSIAAWLPMVLFKLGLTKSLILGMDLYPIYVLWVVFIYFCGFGVFLVVDFLPSIRFDEHGIEMKTGQKIGEGHVFIPVGQIAKIYLAHLAWLDLFVVQTVEGEEYVVGFVQCDAQIQQKLTDCFNRLFEQITTASLSKETLAP